MKLSNLEEQTGQSYPEIMHDFENKKSKLKQLRIEEKEREQRIDKLDEEINQKLMANKVTEQEIDYVVSLRQDLQAYDIELSNVEDLRKYLKNMKQTKENPQLFVEYTKKLGSLIEHMALLRQKEQEQTFNIQRQNENIRLSSIELSELNGQINEAKTERAALTGDVENAKQAENTISARIALLLKVEPAAEKIVDAIGTKQKQLERIEGEKHEKNAQRQALEQQVQELTDKKALVEKEVQHRLNITDYATQLVDAIALRKNQLLSLEKESNEKRHKLAFADTIMNFLTR